MKTKFSILRHALWLAIFLFSLLCQGQNAKAQWWKDTVWTKKTDQADGFYMLKFSKNDSLIVGHGYEMDLFFDASLGYEIKRIPGNNEVHFYNNDQNFIRLASSRKKLEIWDTKSFQVIDSLESDGTVIGSIDISYNEQLVSGIIQNGVRTWDLNTRRILNTKIPNILQNYDKYKLQSVLYQKAKCLSNFNRFVIGCEITYKDSTVQNGSTYRKSYNILFDALTLEGVEIFDKIGGIDFQLSNTNQYIVFHTGDPNYGVEVYDFITKELLWKIPVNGPSLSGIEFSPDDKYLVTSPTITIWNIEKKEEVYTYSSGSSRNIAISHDGRYIINSIGRYMNMWYARWNGNSVNYEPKLLSTIFPNPTTGKAVLKFNLKNSGITTINLSDVNGRIVKPIFEGYLEEGQHEIPFETSEIPSGTYLFTISNRQTLFTFKLIVNR